MEKLTKTFVVGLTALTFFSCGSGSSNTEKLQVKFQEIEGNYESSIKVKSNEITVQGFYTTKTIVEIEVVKTDSLMGHEASLNLHLRGENNSILSTMELDYFQREKLTRLLKDGSGSMNAEFGGYDKLTNDMKTFTIETTWEEKKEKSSSKEVSDKEATAKSKSNKDVNELLDSYDDYMDEYISLSKKINKNPSDNELMSQYQKYMKKTTDLADKLENFKGEMSNEQIQRMIKIQSRMTEALQ